jgi:hypothetical protein
MANQQAINAFGTALGRIGINPATTAAISNNGFATILNLAMVQDEDLDRLPKHLEAWRNPVVAASQQVRIPFVSLKKLSCNSDLAVFMHYHYNTGSREPHYCNPLLHRVNAQPFTNEMPSILSRGRSVV